MHLQNNITKSNNLISCGESQPGFEVAAAEDRQGHRAAATQMTESSRARTFHFFSSQNATVNPNILG